ncbi:MAG: formate dehydrogenase accessory sulfurtransferase FdhD [Rhodothermales bacterium]|nr:formate dehydrogenase accessory sulfurtransferase FdhD [Rhodothermales bacterium]
MEQNNPRIAFHPIVRHSATGIRSQNDALAVEEPLEISVGTTADNSAPVSVTMRTPGHDADLALGFLFTEGILRDLRHVANHGPVEKDCDRDTSNRYSVIFKSRHAPDLERLKRYFYTSSSCGICGKASIEAIRTVSDRQIGTMSDWSVDVLMELPARLRQLQGTFLETGGLHAAALVGADGKLTVVREDVGRHNAVDKIAGAILVETGIDASASLLLLSGRASFELVQKATMCGIPAIASIGAPSTLAVDLARENDMILVGFLSNSRLNVYSGAERITESSIRSFSVVR